MYQHGYKQPAQLFGEDRRTVNNEFCFGTLQLEQTE
jgi:hypothetical protein